MNTVTAAAAKSPKKAMDATAKPAKSAISRRFRAIRDMALVLSAWVGSWAVVILVAKGVYELL